jgi:hypothetical protein
VTNTYLPAKEGLHVKILEVVGDVSKSLKLKEVKQIEFPDAE